MATDHQRKLVWESLVHADILHRYYGYLADRLARRDKWISVLALLFSSSAAAVLLAEWPTAIAKVLALIVAGFNLWLTLSHYGKKSLYSASLQQEFADLVAEWELLWGKLGDLEPHEVEASWRQLNQKGTAITKLAPTELPLDEKLRDRSEGEVIDVRKAA